MKRNKIFYIIIILSIILGTVSLFLDGAVKIVFVVVQFTLIAVAVFMLTPAYHKMMARHLWNKYCVDAEWEYVDKVDPYCVEYNVTLEVYGYAYTGYGFVSAGEKEVHYMACVCPDGTVINIL